MSWNYLGVVEKHLLLIIEFTDTGFLLNYKYNHHYENSYTDTNIFKLFIHYERIR